MNPHFNRFLQSRAEIDSCTDYLTKEGLIVHPLSCKNFDIAVISPALKRGRILDMGADGSRILHNFIKRGLDGQAVGVDLLPVSDDNRAAGADYYESDLMSTPFEDESFQTLTCCSVIEHSVDFERFAKEVYRLLKPGGELFVTFDYAPEKIDTALTKLYNLDWNILSRQDAERLIEVCAGEGLRISSLVDWTTDKMVINPQYCSPVQSVSYTFGLFHFNKM